MTEIAMPPSAEGGEDLAQRQQSARALSPPRAAHFVLAAALVALGDFALFDVTPGAAAGLFAAGLLLSMATLNPQLVATLAGKLIFVALLVATAAIIEEPSFLVMGLGIAGLAAFAVVHRPGIARNSARWMQTGAQFLPQILIRLPLDMRAMPRWAKGQRWTKMLGRIGWVWFVPLSMSFVFLALFASANPILAQWLEQFGSVDVGLPHAAQVGFWFALAFFVWAFLRGEVDFDEGPDASESGTGTNDAQLVTKAIRKGLLSPAVVCRSLVLFNAVFALQNGLDVRFLWAREALPQGVTYAAYAHAGTYPLAASALLAAVFVLLAFPSRSRRTRSHLPAALMYLWMAQTVFLVASAIERMGLYIDAYALTHLRIVGLVVMGLIAAGLVLIACRIALARSNLWLINANAFLLIGTLYIATFADFGRLIADYNVANCREMGGNGVPLDVTYLQSLGPSALPALIGFNSNPNTIGIPKGRLVITSADELRRELQRRQSDWRSWTYRGYRLMQGSGTP